MKRIGFDVDGVLKNLMNPLNEYYNSRFGTDFVLSDYKTFDLWDTWGGTREEAYDTVYNFFHTPYFEKIFPIKNSQKVVSLLSKENDLFIISSRPDYIQNKTIEKLDFFYSNNFNKYFFTHEWSKNGTTRKRDICEKEKLDVMIEDDLNKALEISELDIKVLLFDCPWNQCDNLPENIERVENWEEIYGKLK